LNQAGESSFTGLNTARWGLGHLLEIPFAAMLFERHLPRDTTSPHPGSSAVEPLTSESLQAAPQSCSHDIFDLALDAPTGLPG